MPTQQTAALNSVMSRVLEFARQDPSFLNELKLLAKADESLREEPIAEGDDHCGIIIRRCIQKAKGSRWAAERIRLKSDGACHSIEIAPIDREIIYESRQIPNCSLWMNRPEFQVPEDHRLLDVVAGCFDATATALSVAASTLQLLPKNRRAIHQVMCLVAEAQSALRQAVATVNERHDSDQVAAFAWVSELADKFQIYIDRFMKDDDPADPNRWKDIVAKASVLEANVAAESKRLRKQRKLFKKTSHLLDLLTEAEDSTAEDVGRVATVVDELVDAGFPPSAPTLRRLLSPRLDDFSLLDEWPSGFRQAIRFAEVGQDIRPPNLPAENASGSHLVSEVAKLLRGKTIAILGGDERNYSKKALQTAFKLKDVRWSKGSDSLSSIATVIAKPDVALVLLAIRWSPHSFGEAKNFCDRYRKPLVWLPQGMGVNQVAHRILTQCGERLKATCDQNQAEIGATA